MEEEEEEGDIFAMLLRYLIYVEERNSNDMGVRIIVQSNIGADWFKCQIKLRTSE